eukprot:PITA_32953
MAENRNGRREDERIEGAFPIRETNGDMKMKNTSPSALPHFHGLTTEDPDTFLFEFVVLFRTYDYAEDEKKLKLFPSTLKDAALRWFMGLPGNSITTWAQMQQAFNAKYRDYCRSKETKGEIFRMTMGSDESLEDYEERFQLSYQQARCTLDPEPLKLVLLRGVPEDLLDTLHMLARGDIYQLPYEDIKTVLETILGRPGREQKKEEAERALAIFCPRCTRKHPKNECPLHSVEVCFVCEEDHPTNQCPTLPGFKAMYLGTEAATEPLYFLNQRKPHGPKPYHQGMQETSQAYYNPNQSAHIPSWAPPAHPSWSAPPPWSYPSPYHTQPPPHSFHSHAWPQPQWNAPQPGWRPQYNTPAILPPPPAQPQPLPPAPLRQPQMPAQPNSNPNNRQAQQVYTGETTCPTYVVEIQEINLRSRKVLPERQPPPLEEEEEKQESEPQAIPPFPERLTVTTQPNPEETELLGELKQLCVKIPLLQAIKDVPIYNKLIKEKCFRHPGRRKRDTSTINVIGQLFDLMLGQVICPNYLDPGNPVVDVHINGTIIPHILIDLGAAINVMTRDTMLKLNLQSSLRKTSTILQLANRSTVNLEGIMEDVLVSVDS